MSNDITASMADAGGSVSTDPLADLVSRFGAARPAQSDVAGLVETAEASVTALEDALRNARAAALEEAARLIEQHMLCTAGDGSSVLMPRTNPGNRVGLPYAAAIRAAADAARPAPTGKASLAQSLRALYDSLGDDQIISADRRMTMAITLAAELDALNAALREARHGLTAAVDVLNRASKFGFGTPPATSKALARIEALLGDGL